ncbi:PTS mannose/fructose/sorbose transporter subunit IIB [Bombilactobacillus bombi]|jgi:fructoselysine/glucoselysine PTS system EIIB component|uniref:PTS sugar transporter subunit IIB n=1 Tax=Bombilactobacillus bombi TaxID=1303590 RepID=UPI000E58A2BB|nr:PTS sugar transporter subunit IIB [Bombilactobacillus bombi]AXX65239.1 PTS mannose/fructose/sorbose transporter subunit IIB [Bombilactobacillus bombi]MCO6542084.1 PTS sugar transporter subunit IIB [Lactobacillus sp.]
MIKIVRVDHRLLHGQVIFSWIKQYDINHIIIGDNMIQNDPIASIALKMAKPEDVKMDIVKISDVQNVVSKNSKDKIMILVKGPEQAKELINIIPEIKEINYGGIAKKANSKQYGQAVFLTPEELKQTKDIINHNVKVFIQQVPSSPVEKANFND